MRAGTPPPLTATPARPIVQLQNLVTFGGGLVIAFINGWKMTLVVIAW